MTDIPLLNALIFTAVGVAAFAAALAIFFKAAPLDFWKEIGPGQNVAVAIFAGAVALGLAWIIAAAMH
jgi:putative membrane protein